MYSISSIPTVFTINRATNQGLLPRRADFHKAKPFQIKDQTIINIKTRKDIPGLLSTKLSIVLY